jgi:hypothetical protein
MAINRNIGIGLICILALYFLYEVRNFYIEYKKGEELYNNTIQKVDKYNQLVTREKTPNMTNDEQILFHKNMYQLYHDGISDRYDLTQNKINGVEPNPMLAIYHLNEAIDRGYSDGYILLAKLYHYGIHNLPIDLDKASLYYQHIITSDLNDADEAIKYLATINKTSPGKVSSLRITPPSTKPRSSLAVAEKSDSVPVFSVDDDEVQDRSLPSELIEIKNDTQNVHDHTLINTVKDSIRKLQTSTDMTVNVEDTLKKLRLFIQEKNETDKKSDALKTLDTIERNHQELISFKMKEVDLLNLLWNRIVNNHDNSDELKNNMYDQLADSVEHDSVICSTGRFTRLLDSLNVVDPVVTIKSRALINRELMDKSSALRTELYNKCTEDEQYELDSPTTSIFCMDFSERLKHKLREEFKKDYVDTKVLSQEELDAELSVWINYI